MRVLHQVLYQQQLEAHHKIVEAKGGCVFWKVGKGKTRIAITSALKLISSLPQYEFTAIGIVARRPAFDTWRDEIATLQLDWAIEEIENVDATKALKSDTFVLISDGKLLNQITVATLQRLVKFQQMKCLIVDEGWLFTNVKSQRSKAIQTVNQDIPTIVLSGSLMPSRDLTQIYGQIVASGKGKEVSKSLTDFRSKFQLGINQGAFYSYYPKPGAYKALMDKIEPFTHVYFPTENKGKVTESIIKIQPTKQQLAYFRELRETYSVEGVTEFNSAATLIQKIQQVSDGWLKGEGDGIIEFPSAKIDWCKVKVDEINDTGYPLVIWCAFRHDIERLIPTIQNKNCNVATFRGGEKFDSEGWKKGKYNVCLATEASGSSVNYFAQCPYGIYFSQDYKWRNLEQSQGRHTRKSSLHPKTYFYFLHTNGSMDSKVYYTVKSSKSSEANLIKTLDVGQWLKAK